MMNLTKISSKTKNKIKTQKQERVLSNQNTMEGGAEIIYKPK